MTSLCCVTVTATEVSMLTSYPRPALVERNTRLLLRVHGSEPLAVWLTELVVTLPPGRVECELFLLFYRYRCKV